MLARVRRSAAVLAVLLAACTHAAPQPTSRPAPTTRGPDPTPTLSAGPACRAPAGDVQFDDGTFAFADARRGIAIRETVVYRTVDGGRTWRRAPSFVGPVEALTTAGCGVLYATTYPVHRTRGTPDSEHLLERSDDAGATWHVVARHDLFDLHFVTPDVGYALTDDSVKGAVLEATNDGGRTWRVLRSALGLAVIVADERVLLVEDDMNALWRSTDAGAHFARVTAPYDTTAAAFAPDGREAWATGPTYRGDKQTGWTVRHSTNAGATWQVVRSLPARAEGEVRPVPNGPIAEYAGTVLIGGTDGRSTYVDASVDDGMTWWPATLPGTAVRGGDVADGIRRLQWVDERHAFASLAAPPMRLFETSDGGASWHEVRVP